MTRAGRPPAMRALLVASFVAGSVWSAGAARADVLKVGDRLAELDVATDGAGKPVKLKSY